VNGDGGRRRRLRGLAVVVSVVCGVLGSLVLGLVALYAIALSQWGSSK
jgi:hypothetical protein